MPLIDQQLFYIEVGRLLRQNREKRGLTQETLASLVGLSRTSVTNIEKGRQKVLAHTLMDLASALRITPEALLPPNECSGEYDLDSVLDGISDDGAQLWIKAAISKSESGESHEDTG